MKKAALLLLVLLLTGVTAVSAAPYFLPTYLVEREVRSKLNDPESARFRNVRRVSDGSWLGGIVCGEINARNAFGGYVGYRRFVSPIYSFTLVIVHIDPAPPVGRDEYQRDIFKIVKESFDNAWKPCESHT